jgi:hypothetical protein
MKIWMTVYGSALCLGLTGCSIYDGAIYTSYDQTDISIRSAPETATPFLINFGNQRAVVSFVPHKDTETTGEAVSLFGWANTGSITPNRVIGNAVSAADGAVKATSSNLDGANTALDAAGKKVTDAVGALESAEAKAALGATVPAGLAGGADPATAIPKPEDAKLVAEAEENLKGAQAGLAAATQASSQAATAAAQAANNQRTVTNLQTGTNNIRLLRAQGRFATGSAAKVLVIPQDTEVTVETSNNDMIKLGIIRTPASVRVKTFIVSTLQSTKQEQSLDLGREAIRNNCGTPSEVEKVYALAQKTVDTCFSSIASKVRSTTPSIRFNFASVDYLKPEACPIELGTRDEKQDRMANALNKAYQKFCKKS